MESFFKTLKVERIYQASTKPELKLAWTSSIGSKAFTIIGACIRPSGIGPRRTWKPAVWLHRLVYVESRQGHSNIAGTPTWCARIWNANTVSACRFAPWNGQ